MNDSMILSAGNLSKSYRDGREQVCVLKNLSLQVASGERVAIVGASGSGKSTLLHILGGLDTASAGEVWIAGQNILAMSAKARGDFRNQKLGFVYQFHHLLPEFTALENVAMPLLLRRGDKKSALDLAAAMLEKVGLSHRMTHYPSELSGGERQRAAIARALVTRPVCILADEPTGNLDRDHAQQIWAQFLALNAEQQTAVLFVTHDHDLARKADRIYCLESGSLHLL